MAQLPELAGGDQRLEIGVDRVGALVEHDREGGLGMGGREVVHLLHLLGVDAGRLLGEGVDALADRGDRHLRVQEVRHGRHHGVHVAGVEHREVVVVERHVRVLLGGDVLLRGVGVRDRAEGHALDPPVGEQAGVHAALGAEPDDPETDVLLRHGVSVLWWWHGPRTGPTMTRGDGGEEGSGPRECACPPAPSSLYASATPGSGPPTRRGQGCGVVEGLSPPAAAAAAAWRSSRIATFSSTRFLDSGYQKARASSDPSRIRAGTRVPRA